MCRRSEFRRTRARRVLTLAWLHELERSRVTAFEPTPDIESAERLTATEHPDAAVDV